MPLHLLLRRRYMTWLLVAGGAFVHGGGVDAAVWNMTAEYNEARAVEELRQGGSVIYLRHTDRASGPKEKLSVVHRRRDRRIAAHSET